jgi:hypothetical protein
VSGLKQRVKTAWFDLRGLEPDAVVVSFGTAAADLSRSMAEEARELMPERRHYFVSVVPCDPLPGFQLVMLQSGPAGQLWLQLRRAFKGLRIGMAPVAFTRDRSFAALREAAFLFAPRKILAYNERLERHHLRLSCPLASFLFWRGVPLDRIWLRPWWLWPFRAVAQL